ncbi:uncharacterized protein L203_100702 [Cryptococcus depauperatus CBS 7841]|uniref:Dolichyldiphosphatase n=1 Tax=Cryptococcus depauperatus CBS 7841 TaxID=1295531 RepID=A0AAJ8JNK3_9TREE
MLSQDTSSSLPPLKSFSLTHIVYDPAHPLSVPLTLLSLSPIFLFVSYFTLLIFNRRLTILVLAGGQIANELLSWGLKRLLKGKRPFIDHAELGAGYGMPSSHAQAAGFLAAWGLAYSILHNAGNGRRLPATTIRRWRNGLYIFALLTWSVGVSYSRYHLCYHTSVQIIAGYLIGVVFGCFHFYLTHYHPRHYPVSLPAMLYNTVEPIWQALGGVGGFDIGDAPGGWVYSFNLNNQEHNGPLSDEDIDRAVCIGAMKKYRNYVTANGHPPSILARFAVAEVGNFSIPRIYRARYCGVKA